MYPQVIEEFRINRQLSGSPEDAGLADALDQGFRSAGWKGALTKAIAFREAQRIKAGYFSAEEIAQLYADLGDKDQAFRWLNVAYQEHDWLLIGLKTFIPLAPLRSDPRFAELVAKSGCRSKRARSGDASVPPLIFLPLCDNLSPTIIPLQVIAHGG